jgi:hypothetical protein
MSGGRKNPKSALRRINKTVSIYDEYYKIPNTTEAGRASINPFGINSTTLFTEFINIYSDDNAILNNGDECFFLLMNNTDYFLPVICEGVVMDWKFSEGLTKIYYIQFTKLCDSLSLAKSTIINKNFFIRAFDNKAGKLLEQVRITLLTENFFNGEYANQEPDKLLLFSVNSFFVRGFRRNDTEHKVKQLQNIKNLREKYLKVVEDDMLDNANKLHNFKTLMDNQ